MARKATAERGPVYLTTFQVARLLGVTPPTVVNWVNDGRMTAHLTPGGHRRIAREEVVHFAKVHRLSLPDLDRPPTPDPPSSGVRVLVVEDNPDMSSLARQFLEDAGEYEVEVAASGFEAGLVVGRFRPKVILMDLLMEGMDGFQALRDLQANSETREIPVIAWTASDDPQIEARARREFVEYVRKSEWDQLVTAVERAVMARQRRRVS